MKCVIKGLDINYELLGEGKPLLILHGWGSRSDNWQKVAQFLVEKGLKVIIPDLPGFGRSLAPQFAWDLDDYCGFVKEFADYLNLDRFYLLGHSFGGEIAIKYSLRFPEKIDKLFLVSPSCIRKKSLKVRLFKAVSRVFKVKIPFLRKFFYRKSDYLSIEGVMRETFLKIIPEDLSGILSQIKVPTIIIWGEKDKITPLSYAYLINSKIRNSELKILPGLNHDLNLKEPEKLAEKIVL